ncbi:hypothetical protein VTO58DRAFT_105167 [Aureobasidium pullulans]
MKARLGKNQPLNAAGCKEAYAQYAQNIDIRFLLCTFHGIIGETYDIHGDNKSLKSKVKVNFHSKCMHTSDGKFRVWVYRSKGVKYPQDVFEIKEGTNEELLKVMLERSTGKDAAGNKVVVTPSLE